MKDQPLPLNSVVDLWPWVHFSLGFLTSFGSLSSPCPLFVKEKTLDSKKSLKSG